MNREPLGREKQSHSHVLQGFGWRLFALPDYGVWFTGLAPRFCGVGAQV